MSSFDIGRDVHCSTWSIHHFLYPPVSPTLQGALKDVFGEAIVSSSDIGRDVHCSTWSIHHFLRQLVSPTLQGALKDGFGEAVIAMT